MAQTPKLRDVTGGLPAEVLRRLAREKLRDFALAGATALVLAILGWSFGKISRKLTTHWELQERLPREQWENADAWVAFWKRKRSVLPEMPHIRLKLASAYLRRAEEVTDQRELKRAAAAELAQAERLLRQRYGAITEESLAQAPFRLLLLEQAMLLDELDRDREALAVYEPLLAFDEARAKGGEETASMRDERIELFNCAAYLLACSPDAQVKDPARALALAERCVKLAPSASRNAAILDTLAYACFSAGERERALEVQRQALALTKVTDLPLLLEHYFLFQNSDVEVFSHADGD